MKINWKWPYIKGKNNYFPLYKIIIRIFLVPMLLITLYSSYILIFLIDGLSEAEKFRKHNM